MPALVPFRALRPEPASAGQVAAVPYDVVNRDEAAALASGAPLSFLHVSRAEIDLPPDANPYGDAVYARAVSNFDALKAAAPLVMEDRPSLYVYRLRMGQHEQTGVAACFLVDDYDRDVIRKHERTRRDKEDDRTRHVVTLRAQTGPVFLTYRASAAVDGAVASATRREALFDFTAVDGVRHTVWKVEPEEQTALIAGFAAIDALYIADGHHRAASAARARRELAQSSAPEADSFLAVAFPDAQMQILPYNRLIKDLGTHSTESLLRELRARFAVTDGAPAPSRRGLVAMYLAGRWYTVALGDPPAGLGPADRLDVSRLQEAVLTPLLGIGDARTDKRIDFVGGSRGTSALEAAVNSGGAAVAFAMHPVGVDDLMAISDAGGIMPPKSTWFEPKLRDGLLSHVI